MRAVGTYVLLRVAITIGLAALGRSTPDLPLAILGLAAVDLPWRTATARYAAGAAGVALTTWLASALGLASVTAGAVAVVAVPALVVVAAVLLATAGRARRLGAAALLLLGVATACRPGPAAAHDPGQGRPVAAVTLTGASDGRGALTITAQLADGCAALRPARVVARRAGQTVTGALAATGRCRYAGQVSVTPAGRWFLYAELRDGAVGWRPGCQWTPAALAGWWSAASCTCRPAGHQAPDRPPARVVFGALLYAVGGLLLALTVLQVRRLAPTPDTGAASA